MFTKNVRCLFKYVPLWRTVERDFNFTWQLLDVQVKMPSLSPTMTSGTVVKWLKKEGENVAAGDALCEIQTDKAVVTMEVDDEGILAKIIVPENTPDIEVGTLIAILVEEGKDWKNVKVPVKEASAGKPAERTKPSEKPAVKEKSEKAKPATDLGVQVKMPSLSPTMTSGTVVKWLKKEGENVAAGDALCEIQTDKAVVTMEVDDEGILAKIVVPENTPDIEVGTLIAILVEEGKDWKNVKVPEGAGAGKPAESAKSSEKLAAKEKSEKAKPATDHGRTTNIIGPAVKLMLHLYNIDAKQIKATGPYGILLKGDVMKYITEKKLTPKPQVASADTAARPASKAKAATAAAGRPAAAPGAGFTDVPLTNMRKTIAKRLTQSKMSIPHAYGRISVNMNSIIAFRKQLKSDGVVVSVNDFIIKACASALRQVPEVNVQFVGENVKRMNTVDISVAVATESGLITPIVPNADQLGIQEISRKVKELADKAKANKLQLHEFQGGTFTVSNLGMFGISQFTAIINPPQAAILAVGGTTQNLNEDLKTEQRMVVTLCYDNRAVGDDAAARWLSAFQSALEDSSTMLLGLDSSSSTKMSSAV